MIWKADIIYIKKRQEWETFFCQTFNHPSKHLKGCWTHVSDEKCDEKWSFSLRPCVVGPVWVKKNVTKNDHFLKGPVYVT